MSQTVLIAALIALTVARLVCHLNPGLLSKLDRVARARLLDGADSIIWAGLVALLLIQFVVRSFYIPSGSMLPTLQINDFILVNELMYEISQPARGDIVVFRAPSKPSVYAPQSDKTDLIKRVVGLAHDKVEIKEGRLYLNDHPLDEPYLQEPIFQNYGPIIVKEGHVFMLGDNRNDSKDSRYLGVGQIPLENLVGRAELIFYPLNRLRFFNVRQ